VATEAARRAGEKERAQKKGYPGEGAAPQRTFSADRRERGGWRQTPWDLELAEKKLNVGG